MSYFKDILNYEKGYRKYTVLNVVFNILYAIFNVLSVLAFIPVLGYCIWYRKQSYRTKPDLRGYYEFW